MTTYVVTGVSKGIGFEFLKQLSEDQNNIFVGIVRDKEATEKKFAAEVGERPNVHILQGDLTKFQTLKAAAVETEKIVGDRGVDVLIANGAIVSHFDAFDPIGDLNETPEELDSVTQTLFQTNVTGNIHLFHSFLPLVLKGKTKKIFAISTGLADLDSTVSRGITIGSLYASSKAALNMVIAKFNNQYKKDGVLFLAISPGVVEVGQYANINPEQQKKLMAFVKSIAVGRADFKGPMTPPESVSMVRQVMEKASIEDGFGGGFVSHFGTKKWV